MKTPTRYFNTSGPNIREQHYTLERKPLINKGLDLVHGARYFTIWAPRQTGKSTYFRLLAESLEQEGYKVCHINTKNFQNIDEVYLCQFISSEMTKNWDIEIDASKIFELFRIIHNLNDRKCVFIIDEIEGLNTDLLGQVLRAMRVAFHSRENHCLKSVILSGVGNNGDLIQAGEGSFNISDDLEFNFFSREEVFELLEMHEQEREQSFAENVKEEIYNVTAGQPGLVNGFACKLVEKYPNKAVIEYADYLEIEQYYIAVCPNKNISNIISKSKKYPALIERLLSQKIKIRFQFNDERILELATDGLIAPDQNGNIIFKVPLYQKYLQKNFSLATEL